MAVLKRANALTLAVGILNRMTDSVRARLRKYCTERAKEVGLVSKAYDNEFILGDNVAESRKTVGKLKTLFHRFIIRLIPYVTFASTEFLEVQDRDTLVVNLGTSETLDSYNKELFDWEGEYGWEPPSLYKFSSSNEYMEIQLKADPAYKWIYRYARYLNYIFRKHHIPMAAEAEVRMVFHRDSIQAVQALPTSSERNAYAMKYNVVTKLKFKFVKWGSGSGSFINRYLRLVEGGPADDAMFSDPVNWRETPLIGASIRDGAVFYRYAPEKIFLHLDKALKILNTLTRKVRYGSSAFSFRDS